MEEIQSMLKGLFKGALEQMLEAELDEQMKRVYRCIWIDGKNLETIWEEKTAK